MAAQVAICRSNSAASPLAQLKWIACVLCAIFRARTKREASCFCTCLPPPFPNYNCAWVMHSSHKTPHPSLHEHTNAAA